MAQKAQDSVIVAAEKPQVMAEFLSTMASMAEYEANDASFAGDDIANILLATTEEEMWDADERGPLNGQDLEDCELAITDFTVKFSRGNQDIETIFVTPDGKKMYLMVEAVRISTAGEKKEIRLPAPGEKFLFNTSARFIVAKLFWLRNMGRIPGVECVVKRIDLGGGQGVLKLRPMPKRVERA